MEAHSVQTLARLDGRFAAQRGPAVRVMLLTDRPEGLTARRLASYGSLVDAEEALDDAVAGIVGDAMGYDLFVMDCDAFGGISGAEQAVAALIAAQAKMRIMLVSADFDTPAYPLGLRSAISLPEATPEPLFRRGYDHALRDRNAILIM
jgi:hypothetical protein